MRQKCSWDILLMFLINFLGKTQDNFILDSYVSLLRLKRKRRASIFKEADFAIF